MENGRFLGLDLSTQSLTAVVVDILDALKKKGFTEKIRAIGVSAQQHGSVYLNDRALRNLARVDPSLPLDRQLYGIFSRTTSPMWMDSSTNQECTEITEAQILSAYLHSKWMGQRPQTILVTAGGSENRGLLKIISDVFNAEVQSFEVKDSAASGAAIRAAHCHLNSQGISKCWKELIDPFIRVKVADIVQPDKSAVEIYHGVNGLLNLYAVCERYALGSSEDPEERIAAFRKTLN